MLRVAKASKETLIIRRMSEDSLLTAVCRSLSQRTGTVARPSRDERCLCNKMKGELNCHDRQLEEVKSVVAVLSRRGISNRHALGLHDRRCPYSSHVSAQCQQSDSAVGEVHWAATVRAVAGEGRPDQGRAFILQ